MKIGIATGTRADWGLLQPLATRLKTEGSEVCVYATHQHLIPEMGDTVSEIRADGFEPAAMIPAAGTPAEIMASAASGFSAMLKREMPDALIILGDRCEMLGVASAAMLSGIPIIHIAGGTISEGAFDDSVRHAISKMATLHFPETKLCARRLIQMGENPENITVAGALGVANALSVKRLSRKELTESLGGWDPGENFLMITLHAATLEEGDPLMVQQSMTDALKDLPQEWRFIMTYPNSDIDPASLIRHLHEFEAQMDGRVKVVPSLGRIRYLSAVALSKGVAGNSSSALVEVPSLGVPSLDIGFRQKGREHGDSVIHSEPDLISISHGLRRLISPEIQEIASRKINPYAGNDTVNTMARKIETFNFHPYPVKTFHLCSDTSI